MRNLKHPLLAVAVVVLLAACGGGSDEGVIVDEDDPEPSDISATVTVASASDIGLNGIYATDGIFLNNVTKVNPIGSDPETCRFKFAGPTNALTGRIMGGDIRYRPDTDDLYVSWIAIDGVEFRLEGSTGARVDRASDEIDFAGAVLTKEDGSGDTIALTGSIPMLPNRPGGC